METVLWFGQVLQSALILSGQGGLQPLCSTDDNEAGVKEATVSTSNAQDLAAQLQALTALLSAASALSALPEPSNTRREQLLADELESTSTALQQALTGAQSAALSVLRAAEPSKVLPSGSAALDSTSIVPADESVDLHGQDLITVKPCMQQDIQ